LRRVTGESGYKYRSVITLPSRRGPRCSIRICIRIRDRLIIALRPAVLILRFLPKYCDLSSTHVHGLLGICIQGTLNAIHVRKNDVRVSYIGLDDYTLDLAKPMEDGADVGFDGVWW